MERKLVVPGIYKDFENKLHNTIGVSYPTECIIDGVETELVAKHTESLRTGTVMRNGDKMEHCNHELGDKVLVIYKSLYDETGVYATPLEVFLSEIDHEKYPLVTQSYRMELVGGLFKENIVEMLQDTDLLNHEDITHLKKAEQEKDYILYDDSGDICAAYERDTNALEYQFSGNFYRELAKELFRFIGYRVDEVETD